VSTNGPVGDSTVTAMLKAWRGGDAGALERLVPLVHAELHRLAEGCMRGERPDHTLQATALVNEAYLRLIDQHQARWQNRAPSSSASQRSSCAES